MSFVGRVRAIVLLASLGILPLGCGGESGEAPPPEVPAPDALGDASQASDATFFTGSRRLDLTRDSRPDSVALVARGDLPDSVTAVIRFFVDGSKAYTETWSSSYELMVRDADPADSTSVEAFLTERLTRSLESVRLEPLDTASMQMFSGLAVLDSISPRPTMQVTLSYGYETTVALAFDRRSRRFVTLWACC